MEVILALKIVHNSHRHKKTIISQLIIMMEKSYNECVGGPTGVNIPDDFEGVMAPGSKALASVHNSSSSRGGGWRKLVGPRYLLEKDGHSSKVLATWRTSLDPQGMLKIFGWGSDWLGPITTPDQEFQLQEEIIDLGSTPVGDILPKTDVRWRSLVGACVGSRYLIIIGVS